MHEFLLNVHQKITQNLTEKHLLTKQSIELQSAIDSNLKQIKANDFAQEAGAIIGMTHKIRRRLKLTIEIEHVKGHPKRPKDFDDDPVSWTMIECDKKAKQARIQYEENNRNETQLTKMDYSIMVDQKHNHKSIIELVKTIDYETKEKEHAQ